MNKLILSIVAIATFSLSASADYVDLNIIQSSDVVYTYNFSNKNCISTADYFSIFGLDSDSIIKQMASSYPEMTAEKEVLDDFIFVMLHTNKDPSTTMVFTNSAEACETYKAILANQ